jgi:hypothetical protein
VVRHPAENEAIGIANWVFAMRHIILSLLALVTFLGSATISTRATAQSACGAARTTSEFANCVDDAATYQCRDSASLAALRACFARTARMMVGTRLAELERWNGGPLHFDCTSWFFNGLFACSVHELSGAPEEWCFRNDVNTVSWCEGDPPNHKCRTLSCPIATCSTASNVLTRCGMVWRPGLK